MLPNTSYYLKGIRQSNQYRSSPGTNFFFSLNIQITLPSEHFIISDVTQNKLYSFPGIRISRLLTPGMCANESVSFVLKESKRRGRCMQSQICCGKTSGYLRNKGERRDELTPLVRIAPSSWCLFLLLSKAIFFKMLPSTISRYLTVT